MKILILELLNQKQLQKKFTEKKNKNKMCDQNALLKIVCVHLLAIQL